MPRFLLPVKRAVRPAQPAQVDRTNLYGQRTLFFSAAFEGAAFPVRLDKAQVPTVAGVATARDVGGAASLVSLTGGSPNSVEWPSSDIDLSRPFTMAVRLRRNAAGSGSYDRIFHANGAAGGGSRFQFALLGSGDAAPDRLAFYLFDSGGTQISTALAVGDAAVSLTAFETYVFTHDGANTRLYRNGLQAATTAATTFPAATLPNPIRYGTDSSGNGAPVSIQFAHIMRGVLTVSEVAEYSRNPWQVLRSSITQRQLFTPASTGTTGTGASPQALNTSTAAGAVGITGSSARTQARNTSSGAGSAAVAGTGASTQALNTSSEAGQEQVAGSAASTQALNTSAASGTVGAAAITGTGASTQAANTSVGSGSVGVAGSAADTQTNASAGTGAATITGTGASTQALNTSSEAGQEAISGSAGSTQAINTTAATASNAVSGSAADTQALNTSAGNQGASSTGSAADTQAPNSSAAGGAVGVTGSAASTQAINASGANASAASAASVAIAQAQNSSAALVAVAITGAAAAIQAASTSSATGSTGSGAITGTGASTQAPNVSTTTPAVDGGAGEYPKKKKRYVVKVGDKLVQFSDPRMAMELANEPELEVPIKALKAKAKVHKAEAIVKEVLKQKDYGKALELYEDMQDEEDIEMLLLSL